MTAVADIQVCVDCLMLIANGEVMDGDGNDIAEQHAAKIEARWPSSEWYLASGSDEESHFSWSSCEGCGSNLGGDRETAHAIRRTA